MCKNTRMGEILIKYFSGKQKYTQTNLRGYRKGKVNEVEIEIFNRAQYNLTPNSVKEITISAKDFILLLNRNLKSILRNLSLKTIDSKQKLSKRQTELYAIVKEHVDAQDITLLGQM